MVFACLYVCAPYACGAYGDQKKASDPHQLEVQTVSLHVSTVEKNLVLMQGKQVLLTTEPSLQATTLGVETEFITGM